MKTNPAVTAWVPSSVRCILEALICHTFPHQALLQLQALLCRNSAARIQCQGSKNRISYSIQRQARLVRLCYPLRSFNLTLPTYRARSGSAHHRSHLASGCPILRHLQCSSLSSQNTSDSHGHRDYCHLTQQCTDRSSSLASALSKMISTTWI